MASEKAERVDRMSFPEALLAILAEESLSNIITWLPHGKAFYILDKESLVSDVLLVHFKHNQMTRYASFTRKLNRWGFKQGKTITDGVGAFRNPLFQRDKPELCRRMVCQHTPKSKAMKPARKAVLSPIVGFDLVDNSTPAKERVSINPVAGLPEQILQIQEMMFGLQAPIPSRQFQSSLHQGQLMQVSSTRGCAETGLPSVLESSAHLLTFLVELAAAEERQRALRQKEAAAKLQGEIVKKLGMAFFVFPEV